MLAGSFIAHFMVNHASYIPQITYHTEHLLYSLKNELNTSLDFVDLQSDAVSLQSYVEILCI